ncbi:MAG: HipA domain-containing protein [Gammaproteobacteria bacterium]|nr:HipA domain-containing protein [Gammaproteobacteria bacterium]
MKRCPITYDPIGENEIYSQQGLRMLSPQLKILHPLAFDAAEQRSEAIARVGKMSIQGVQTKLSAQLQVKEGCFLLVDQQGRYILKPQSDHFPQLPENEALTMTLAAVVGIEVPVHGLIYSKDHSLTYFIKRFDRVSHNNKLAMEDFAQLSGLTRDTKYESSMEKIVDVILRYCTFPKIEFVKLFKLTLFNYLVGNEDMHLKNFSLLTRDHIIGMSPAYDLLNSTIAMPTTEELALPLKGKKKNLTQKDFFVYFALERLQLQIAVIERVIDEFKQAQPKWENLIRNSFLSSSMQDKYMTLLRQRSVHLGLIREAS